MYRRSLVKVPMALGLVLGLVGVGFFITKPQTTSRDLSVARENASNLRPADLAKQQLINANYGRLPLSFEANQGQAEETVKFLARGGNGRLALSATEAALALPIAHVRIKLTGANPQPRLSGVEPLPRRVNYLRGRDPQKWQTEVPTYAKVRYEAVYPGVDWVFYGNQQQLEYDFIVAPNADPRAIRMQFAGVESVQLNDADELILQTSGGPVRQMQPYIYQAVAGKRRAVVGSYKLRGAQEVGFEVGAYDRSQPLVIDPVLVFAARTLPGNGLTVDALGNAYIISPVFPAQFNFVRGPSDLVVTKINASGTQQLFATVIGGGGAELATDVAVDSLGNVLVTGRTNSPDFPGPFPGVTTTFNPGIFFSSVDGAANWEASGSGLTARPTALVHDPNTAGVLYAGYEHSASLSKSVDGGKTWTTIGQALSDLAPLVPLAVASGNPATVYVNTSGGLRKSDDGGVTWRSTGLSFPFIAFATDPRQPQTLYAAANEADSTYGVVYKSTDGGQTWNKPSQGLDSFLRNSTQLQLIVDPTNSATVYALGWLSLGLTFNVFARSNDGGVTWRQEFVGQFINGLVRALAIHPAEANKLLIGTQRGLYQSMAGGAPWQLRTSASLDFSTVLFDPLNPANVYGLAFTTGTSGPQRPLTTGRIYKSTDGGTNWRLLDNQLKDVDVTARALDPKAPAHLSAVVLLNKTDAFLLKLRATGDGLDYAKLLGTRISNSGPQGSGEAVAVDAQGNAYVGGNADPYVLLNGLPETAGTGFLQKMNAQGDLLYSTKLPGKVFDLALDTAGKVYATGELNAPLTVKNGFQAAPADSVDGFIMKLDPQQTGAAALLYASYLGGTGSDSVQRLAVNGQGQVYLAGYSTSANFSIANATVFKPQGNAFLAKLDPGKTGAASLLWSTKFNANLIGGLAVDAADAVYVTGGARTPDFPVTPGALQTKYTGGSCETRESCQFIPPCYCPLNGTAEGRPPCSIISTGVPNTCDDVFLMKLNGTGTALLYSTLLGRNGMNEDSQAIALDAAGNVYLSGLGAIAETPSTPIAGTGGFVAKLSLPARLTALATLSAASFSAPPLAPESLATGFLDAAGEGADKLQVVVKDDAGVERAAPVNFAGAGQVNFQIPSGTALGVATVSVTSNGATIASGTIQIATVAPGVFTANANGRGVPAAVILRVRADGSSVYEPLARLDPATNRFVPVPIDLGPEGEQVLLVFFGTGWRGRSAEQNVSVSVSGVSVPLLYAGVQPTIVGLDQINARLPRALAGRGEVDVVVTADGKTANTVRVAIR